MSEILWAAVYAVFVWWFGTGLVLLLDKLPRATYPWTMFAATAVMLWSMVTIGTAASHTGYAGVFAGFTAAVLVWAWLELGYFMGYITGPREAPCPPGARGLARFWPALQASLYHELSIVGLGTGIALLVAGQPNRTALWTFLVLWLMRWSAKLNLFLGVPRFHHEFLPAHMQFLRSYIPRRSMNPLFPVSVFGGTLVAVLLWAGAVESRGVEAAALALVATMLTLAVLEHWFLVLPVHDAALWQWAVNAARRVGVRS